MRGFDSAVVTNPKLFRMLMGPVWHPVVFRNAPGMVITDDTRMDILCFKKGDFLRMNKKFTPYRKTK